MAYVFSIASDVLTRTDVLGFRGKEAVSRPFAFDIALRVEGEVGDPAAIVHEPLVLEMRGELGVQRVAGIASSAKIVHVDGNGALMRLTLVPTFWRTSLSRHNRVFTDVTVPQIIEAVLREDEVRNVDVRLVDSYAVREHVGQYRESNLDFVSRLMEREGIFYFFEHDGDTDRMVIADHASAFAVSREQPVAYRPAVDGGASYGESFFQMAMKKAALPRNVQLTDWNYRTPQVSVKGQRGVAQTTPGAIVRHGDNVLNPDEAMRYARIRSEELGTRETTFRASGPVSFLVSGGRFTVEGHPREALNRELVAISIEHIGTRIDAGSLLQRVLQLPTDISYRANVIAVPSEKAFRPSRSTARPTIQGLVDGVIDGSASSPYAQVDEHGRYKVRLKLDEGDPIDGSNSTWIRMLQPHGGGTEGWHFPLRKQTEVHVAFAYGDPDRPIIVGVAHNPEKPSVVTAGNHTQNVMQTGGLNRLEMEDLAGAQRVDLSCPTLDSYLHLGAGAYQFEANTSGEGWWSTGADTEVTVDGNKTEDVLANVLETYLSTQSLTVIGAVTETMLTNRTTTVVGPQTDTWAGPLIETVTNPVLETYNAGLDLTVSAAATLTYNVGETLTVTGGVTEIHGATQSTVVTGSLTHTVTGSATELFGATSTRLVDGDKTLTVDGAMTVVAPKFEGVISAWSTLDDATKDHIEDTVVKYIAQDITITPMSASVSALSVSVYGKKTTINGFSLGLTGASASLYGMYTNNFPGKTIKAGAEAHACGIAIVMKGLAFLH